MLLVEGVGKKSAAYKAGIRKGDSVVGFEGVAAPDILDCEFYEGAENFSIEFLRNGKKESVRVVKEPHEPLGLTFGEDALIKTKACANKCIFCFVDQLPKSMRKSLYFKDDDWRLSFISGNYVTFTNLKEGEAERICGRQFSPLYVSVHATDDAVRRTMLRNEKAPAIMPMLKKFAGNGIELHTQIVLCPGFNDGEILRKTLEDLFSLYPKLSTVAIVPVGLTAHREKLCPLNPVTESEAKEIIGLAEEFSKKIKKPFVYCSDEFYLTAKLPVPEADFYGDYAQIENGVGLLAKFESEFQETLNTALKPKRGGFTVVTGTAAAKFMEKLVGKAKEKFPEAKCNVVAIRNEFFGASITVSGLITAGDIIKQTQAMTINKTVLIPSNMLKRDEPLFLDGISVKELSKALKRKVQVIYDGHEFCRALLKVKDE